MAESYCFLLPFSMILKPPIIVDGDVLTAAKKEKEEDMQPPSFSIRLALPAAHPFFSLPPCLPLFPTFFSRIYTKKSMRHIEPPTRLLSSHKFFWLFLLWLNG